jgi:toxin-antitoxin system PIN domain toxin
VIVPDANLLLYAYDSACPFHAKARRWWEACLSGNESVGLTHSVIFAFVRIGTSPRAFTDPMTLPEVSGHILSWLARGVTQVIEPEADHTPRVLELLVAAGSAGGNLVTDAQIAAIALVHRAVVHTADRDFLRFPGLRCRYPLDER